MNGYELVTAEIHRRYTLNLRRAKPLLEPDSNKLLDLYSHRN